MDRHDALSHRISEFIRDVVEAEKLLQPNETVTVYFRIEEIPKVSHIPVPLPPTDTLRLDRQNHVASVSERLAKMSIEELKLETRSFNVLRNQNVLTVGQLIQNTEYEVLKFKNSGLTTVADIRRALTEHGLTLLNSTPFTGKTFDDLGIRYTLRYLLRERGITDVDEMLKAIEKGFRKAKASKDPNVDVDIVLFRSTGVPRLWSRLQWLGHGIPPKYQKGSDRITPQ